MDKLLHESYDASARLFGDVAAAATEKPYFAGYAYYLRGYSLKCSGRGPAGEIEKCRGQGAREFAKLQMQYETGMMEKVLA
jgi:hypothetical protein